MPPEPFHPHTMEMIMPITPITHILFNLESYNGSGRNGMSWCFRIIRVQLMRNAKSVVTNENWIMGIWARLQARMCAQMRMGHMMMRDRPENCILGALPNYLYSNSFQVTGSGVGAGVIYISLSSMSTSGIYIVFLSWLIKKYYPTISYNQILKIMKLTTVNPNKSKNDRPISNVFKLKQMIQKAASGQHIDNKQNMQINTLSTLPDLDHITLGYKFPKSAKNGGILDTKVHRSKSEVSQREDESRNHPKLQLNNLNLEKLKINPVMASSVKSISSAQHHNKPTNFLIKSKSNKMISNKKIQGLSKSFRYSAPTIRESLSIDSFNVGRKLGKGRFGNVYAAQQKSTNFVLAIKIVNKKQLKESQMEQQLISQIKLQSYMKHPNILQMYGYFHDQLNIYLMLELAEECLFKDLRRKTCFSQKQVAYYTKQIIQGLRYMHNENIIHRDLKPENIMIVHNVIKLADFGWSVYSPLYKRQTFCGTLDYVPPEIVKGDFYDERVDVWSLGILIFELTFGYAPFEGSNSQEETFEKIINGEFQIPGHISDNLKRIIKYILISDPRMRLNLGDIQQSNWLRAYEKQGRTISQDIWDFWELKRAR